KLEAGTFAEPVTVGITGITDPALMAEIPEEYVSLGAFTLDLQGKKALKPFDISIPAPAGITENDVVFCARVIDVLGENKLMIIDSTQLENGRVQTACEPFDDEERTYGGIFQWVKMSFSTPLGYITGYTYEYATTISWGNLYYKPGMRGNYIFPSPLAQSAVLKIQDNDTGETLYEKVVQAPTVAGQVYSYQTPNEADREPPQLVRTEGLKTYYFDVISPTRDTRSCSVRSVLTMSKGYTI
ncbi:MAG: hypothetical protein GY757_57605, partial [bacterium]|nr:hypothetical protein [bacterium]